MRTALGVLFFVPFARAAGFRLKGPAPALARELTLVAVGTVFLFRRVGDSSTVPSSDPALGSTIFLLLREVVGRVAEGLTG